MKKLPKWLPFLLVFSLLLSSCGIITPGNRNAESEEEETSAESGKAGEESRIYVSEYPGKAKEFVDALPNVDFEGIAVLIATTVSPSLFVPEEEESDLLSEVIAERNQTVADKLNTIVLVKGTETASLLEEVRAASLSGTYYADLLAVPSSLIGTLKKENLLVGLGTLPYVDLSSPYFNQSSRAQFTRNGVTYAIAGSAVDFPENDACIFVNNALASSLGIDSPASKMQRGEWTLDAFFDAVSRSTGIFGVYGFGYDLPEEEIASFFYNGSGLPLLDPSLKSFLPPQNAFADKVAEALSPLTDPSYRYNKNDGNAYLEFYNGKMLFYVDRLGEIPWIFDMNDDWSVLPIPKVGNDRGYVCTALPSAPVIALPACNTDAMRAGILLQTLFAASYGIVREGYTDLVIEKYARNNDTLNAVDLIGQTGFYSFENAFGGEYPVFFSASRDALMDAITGKSSLKEAQEKVLTGLERAGKEF